MEKATLANGCFWCTEAVFKRIKGVSEVMPGYSNDAEAIQITFDPAQISYRRLLEIFFGTHNPTTLNRQGADIGPQYRSAIFYHNEDQKNQALEVRQELNASGKYEDPIVTEVTAFGNFYPAEDYHRDYYERNRNQAYCQVVIDPKIQKLLKEFSEDLA